MYSNKENVNILTALLVAHGVRHAVLCPGSRNSPIVHNLNECPEIQCFPVTDERSAGFYALGMTQATGEPVAVCVTSGTALLNLAPAVAEAYYQHRPLVVISADRPPQWIDQLDGQTLPQPDALGRFVRKAVSLPEPHDEESRWYCNRLVNEALVHRNAPVHINVPISEPLFEYTIPILPQERKIVLDMEDSFSSITYAYIMDKFMHAERPLLVYGQPLNLNWDETVYLIGDDDSYVPDFVLYTGGSIVSKRVKQFLRKAKETWAVNITGEIEDTFQNLTRVIRGDGAFLADQIRVELEARPHPFVRQWYELTRDVRIKGRKYVAPYSQMATVRYFEDHYHEGVVHYANSTAIRLANIYAWHKGYCNRGVNGIEGSLSTAAGMSVVTDERVYCVIGDLSFFYDSNALWNQNLRGNFRVLLLNNGKGGIFNMLRGLEQSPARDKFVAAAHRTTAEGVCLQNGVVYRKAEDMEQMQQGIDWLFQTESEHPLLLEVLTDASEDERAFRDYYRSLR